MKRKPLAAVFLLLGGLTACHHSPAPEAVARTVYVVRGSDAQAAPASLQATVVARTEVELGFRAGGRLLQRHVEPGDRVRRGQVLAQLEDTELRWALQAAESQLAAAVADARQQGADAGRLDRLRPDGSVGEAEAERQQTAALAAAARQQAAIAQRELAAERLSHTTLRAPFDGVVVAVRAEPGQVLAEGGSALRLASPGMLELQIDLPPAWASQARTLRLTALEREWRLRSLEPAAQAQTRTQRTRWEPTQPLAWREDLLGRTLMVPMPAAPGDTLSLPAGALLKGGGPPQVWRVEQGRVVAQVVTLKGRDGDRVRLSGLSPDWQIVALGAPLLQSGQAVRTLPLERMP